MAFIDDARVAFEVAVQRCADLLAASAQPVFAHLGVDVAGAREAVRIAERTGGVLDHVASESLLRDLDPLRETGGLTTTPLEADVRADLVLLIGDVKSDPNLAWLARPARPNGEPVERRLVSLAGDEESLRSLASLRWGLKRPGEGFAATEEALRAAKFGVAIWRAEDLPTLAVEAVHGLVRDLNETTRFSTLALAAPDNGLGVQAVCGWMTGFPLRTGFGRGWPEHDPWRYDARRLIAAGETDCVVWVSSLPGGAAPPDRVDILLDDGRAVLAAVPRVRIVVSSARPGGVMFDPRVGTLVASPSGSVGWAAAALAAIRERLEAALC
jgi:formylmethanofuran dehydrogenase subunit B